MQRIGAVVMMGTTGKTPQEEFVTHIKQIVTIDLIHLLKIHGVTPIILCTPQTDWIPIDADIWLSPDPTGRPFHFGNVLVETITAHRLHKVIYFGGASAPLLDNELMGMLVGLVQTAGEHGSRIPEQIVLTNNIHSSDWAAITNVQHALSIIKNATSDNSLVWLLQNSGKYEARILTRLRPSAEFDIDTPSDIALLYHHPACSPAAIAAIESYNFIQNVPIRRVIDILKREGSHATLIGRVPPKAWETLNRHTKSWIRVFSEERGMVASERLSRGEVRSLLGYLLEAKGAKEFFRILSDITETALIDTRVLMAHQGKTFSQADRYASDLFMVDAIQDPWLREFTAAAAEAPMPIVLGGHSVVAGGLYVLCDILSAELAVH
jgi:hypothetical protein